MIAGAGAGGACGWRLVRGNGGAGGDGGDGCW